MTRFLTLVLILMAGLAHASPPRNTMSEERVVAAKLYCEDVKPNGIRSFHLLIKNDL